MIALLALGSAAAQDNRPPNPHWQPGQCARCHSDSEPGAMAPSAADAVCARCHDAESVAQLIHPLGIPPGPFADRMAENAVPLVNGGVGCVSCHDMAIQCLGDRDARSANPMFLRGPAGGDVFASCFQCHDGDTFTRDDPHAQINEDGSIRRERCAVCHRAAIDPRAAETTEGGGPLMIAEPQLCAGCHSLGPHPRGVNHIVTPGEPYSSRLLASQNQDVLAGMTPRQVAAYLAENTLPRPALPLSADGGIVCSTCHNPHEAGVFAPDDVRGQGAESAPTAHQRLRLEGEALCAACHGR